jgi:hypothetical protein
MSGPTMSEREIEKWQDVFQCLPVAVRGRIISTASSFYDEHPEARGVLVPRFVVAMTVRNFYIQRRAVALVRWRAVP